ncbi:Aste57867_16302 [Aphanomyces stellatus]|uniref:Aste57867_16302 protein n=1 Tax=Aphanomyces stellatus TaxID=120398 RepID=A0A485L6H2_9STRA|nr:hypothetical protein As57867_016245 [Aphanomyces stellatus]VFT93078.1 Aste57867_16302 [Aphanomyces stellatus]
MRSAPMRNADDEFALSNVTEVLAAIDTVLARRRYQREKQRQHRRKTKDERALLLDELATLQAKLPPDRTEHFMPDGMLSWRVIADVFRAGSSRAKAQKQSLEEETSMHMAVIHDIQQFLHACRPVLPSSRDLGAGNHSFVALLASAESRSRAKQWLTQQLYHNTDRAFASFPTDVGTDDFVHCEYRFNQSQLHGSEMYQAMFNAPLKAVVAMQQRKLHWTRLDLGEFDVERDGNTTLYRDVNEKEHYWNLLEGHFYEADRCVIVYRRIQDDEAYSSRGCYEHHALQWMDIRQINPKQTLVRFFSLRTVMRPIDGWFPILLDAKHMLTDDTEMATMTASSRHVSASAQDHEVTREFQAQFKIMREALDEMDSH